MATLGEGAPFPSLLKQWGYSVWCLQGTSAGMDHARLEVQLVSLQHPAGHSHAPHCCLCWGCCRTRPFETLPGITGISGRLGMYIQPGAHLCLAEHWLYAQGCQQHSSREAPTSSKGAKVRSECPGKATVPSALPPDAPCCQSCL